MIVYDPKGERSALKKNRVWIGLSHRPGFPPELFANARSDLLGAIALRDFDVSDARLAKRFLLDRISGRSSPLVMPASLILDRYGRPAPLIDD
jgi:hypothetical protein